MPQESTADLAALETGPSYRFMDWPDTPVKRTPGVYTVWESDRFLYVGMGGRRPSRRRPSAHDVDAPDQPETINGLWGRLNAHASGRRSGNQFCVYVCDRFVVPKLTAEQQSQIEAGELFLDDLTRTQIRDCYEYRFVHTADAKTAHDLEAKVRHGALGVGKPFLNPLPATRRPRRLRSV
jgi:hypothetical protein